MRGNNPAQCMTPWQDNPAMIDFRRRAACLLKSRCAFLLNQRSATCRTPILGRLQFHHGVAMATDEFHN